MSAVKKIPLRKCAGCGEMKPKKDMMRIIRNEEQEVMVDLSGKKNGRGAYICQNEECLKKAHKNKGLERSLKMSVSDEIYEQLKKEMNQ